MALTNIDYFINTYKTDYAVESDNPEHIRSFDKYSEVAERFILAICGIPELVVANYTDIQIETIKHSVSLWIEQWLMNGFDLTPTGSQSVQALGFNQSVSNPKDPSYVPRQIKYDLIRVGLHRSIIGVKATNKNNTVSPFTTVDDSEWGF